MQQPDCSEQARLRFAIRKPGGAARTDINVFAAIVTKHIGFACAHRNGNDCHTITVVHRNDFIEWQQHGMVSRAR
jgi:hypothetical protein